MKTVKVLYHCDYCGKLINTDDEAVHAFIPGRIGYQDNFIPDKGEDDAQHYHEDCFEFIRGLTFQAVEEMKGKTPEEKKEEVEPEKEPVKKTKPKTCPTSISNGIHKGAYTGPVTRGVKDLGALKAFLDAGKSKDWIADEFGVSKATIYNWMKELGGQK